MCDICVEPLLSEAIPITVSYLGLSYLAARPSLALRTLHVFIPFFARPTDPPSREGGRWETKHFIKMA